MRPLYLFFPKRVYEGGPRRWRGDEETQRPVLNVPYFFGWVDVLRPAPIRVTVITALHPL